MVRFYLAAAFVAASLAPVALCAGESKIRDGDTIVVNGTPVRLKGLSCAETKTDLGKYQKIALQALWDKSSSVNCTLTGEKTWDREVGWCSLDGKDIGIYMIENAGCQPCRHYDTTGKYINYKVTGEVPKYCK